MHLSHRKVWIFLDDTRRHVLKTKELGQASITPSRVLDVFSDVWHRRDPSERVSRRFRDCDARAPLDILTAPPRQVWGLKKTVETTRSEATRVS